MTDSLMQYRDQAADALYPFLAGGAQGDPRLVKAIAIEAIDGYAPKTPREIQLSAQILACSFAAIACLRSAAAAEDLPLDEMFRLHDAALKMDAEANKATRALEAKQRERQRAPQAITRDSVAWDHMAFNRIINSALRKMREADAKIADKLPKPVPMKPNLRLVSAQPMTTAVLAALAGYNTEPEGEPAAAKPKRKPPKFRLVKQ